MQNYFFNSLCDFLEARGFLGRSEYIVVERGAMHKHFRHTSTEVLDHLVHDFKH